jgi:hypothetical protein
MALQKRDPFSGIGPAFITSLLIVMFLFYIDEGYYDFRWMKDIGNWIAFFVYFIFTFTIMWVVSYFLLGRLTGWVRWATVMLTGFSLTLLIIFTLFR